MKLQKKYYKKNQKKKKFYKPKNSFLKNIKKPHN